MDKSVHTTEYECFLQTLKSLREASGITQVELAESLGISQSHLSKMERGELRIDIVQTRNICLALGSSLPQFAKALENAIKDQLK